MQKILVILRSLRIEATPYLLRHALRVIFSKLSAIDDEHGDVNSKLTVESFYLSRHASRVCVEGGGGGCVGVGGGGKGTEGAGLMRALGLAVYKRTEERQVEENKKTEVDVLKPPRPISGVCCSVLVVCVL